MSCSSSKASITRCGASRSASAGPFASTVRHPVQAELRSECPREAIEVGLSELCDLRRNDDLAVRLLRIVREVVLVIRLGGIVRREGFDLGHDRIIPNVVSL